MMLYNLAPAECLAYNIYYISSWEICFELRNYLEGNYNVKNVYTNFRQHLALLKCKFWTKELIIKIYIFFMFTSPGSEWLCSALKHNQRWADSETGLRSLHILLHKQFKSTVITLYQFLISISQSLIMLKTLNYKISQGIWKHSSDSFLIFYCLLKWKPEKGDWLEIEAPRKSTLLHWYWVTC